MPSNGKVLTGQKSVRALPAAAFDKLKSGLAKLPAHQLTELQRYINGLLMVANRQEKRHVQTGTKG